MDIKDLVNQCGSTNIPGVKTTVYVVCSEDVDTIPDVIGGPNPGDKLRINGDIVLKANKAWAKFTIISETGKVEDVQMGPKGSKSFGSTFDWKVPNTGAEVTEWIEDRANGCFIALVETLQGHVRLLGNIGLPVEQVTATGTSGENGESERVWAVQWKSPTGRPALYYTGNVDIDPLT